jgi:hypothetical protein
VELKGRLAIVTGASTGIGAATARLLAREREVVVPFMLRLFWIFERPFPGLTRWLLRTTGVKHPATRRGETSKV